MRGLQYTASDFFVLGSKINAYSCKIELTCIISFSFIGHILDRTYLLVPMYSRLIHISFVKDAVTDVLTLLVPTLNV